MFNRHIRAIVFVSAVCLASGSVRADGGATVDNPLYKAWASHAVGSSAAYSAEGTGPGGKPMAMTITSTLKEKTDESVTVESAIDGHTHSRTIPAKIPADAVKSAGDDEDVKAMDKTIKCKKVEMSAVADGESGSDKATICLSDEVVGGLVKMVVSGPNGPGVTVTITASDAK
jgi:hypothetical protein